jgi:hypothetical protein
VSATPGAAGGGVSAAGSFGAQAPSAPLTPDAGVAGAQSAAQVPGGDPTAQVTGATSAIPTDPNAVAGSAQGQVEGTFTAPTPESAVGAVGDPTGGKVSEARAQADQAQAVAADPATAAGDRAMSASGVDQPVGQVRGAQADVEGRAGQATSARDQARAAVDDPSGAVQGKASSVADDKIREHTPADPTADARAKADTAVGVVDDPAGAARGAAEAKVETSTSGGGVGVSGSATVKPPDPKKS